MAEDRGRHQDFGEGEAFPRRSDIVMVLRRGQRPGTPGPWGGGPCPPLSIVLRSCRGRANRGASSVDTRRSSGLGPLRAAVRGAFALGVRILFKRLHTQFYLVIVLDVKDFDADGLADLEDVADALDPVMGDLGDVHQPDEVGHDLDERAVFLDPDDLAGVGPADLGFGGDLADHLLGLFGRFQVGRGDGDLARLVDVDLGFGQGDDSLDDFAAGPDDFADLLGVDEQGVDVRGEGRDVRPRRGQGLFHLVQDLEPGDARLGQRFADDFERDRVDLEVELDGGDALLRAGDLEIHVAEVVLEAGDVGQDGSAGRPP